MTRSLPACPVAAHELALYAVNDAELYRSRTVAIIANLRRKHRKGTYNHDLAVKGWRYLADDAARKYVRDFGGETFNPATRELAAVEIRDHYDEAVRET